MSKLFKPFIKLFRIIYLIIDKWIVTPISRVVYKIGEFSKENSGRFEKILNRPNVLIYVSLLCAGALFVLIDSQVINLTEHNAEIIEGQKINAIYNEEAYIIEGIPETVDITLIGSKSSLYLATQLGDHQVELDLSKYSAGTYKVKLKYNHSVTNVNYKLEPSTVTVKISEKVSKTKNLTYSLLNEDKIDQKLSISGVVLDANEVVIKSSQEILNKVAVVKALVDASQVELKETGDYTLENVPLVVYDENGNKITNIEIVPAKVTATVSVDSYHATKPVKIVTTGEMSDGKAISTITSSVKEVEVYGDKEIVDKITNIEGVISISKLDSDKTLSVTLDKPSGVRYMSETSTSVTISIGDAAQRTISGVSVQTKNLGDNLTANALTTEDKVIDVILKGVDTVINDPDIDASKIIATVDLSGLKAGTHTLPIEVTIDNERISVQAVKTEITVKITQK